MRKLTCFVLAILICMCCTGAFAEDLNTIESYEINDNVQIENANIENTDEIQSEPENTEMQVTDKQMSDDAEEVSNNEDTLESEKEIESTTSIIEEENTENAINTDGTTNTTESEENQKELNNIAEEDTEIVNEVEQETEILDGIEQETTTEITTEITNANTDENLTDGITPENSVSTFSAATEDTASVTVTIPVIKTISNVEETTDEFTFKLQNLDGTEEQIISTYGPGTAEFNLIYTAEDIGIHTYMIVEVPDTTGYWEYDDSVWYATVLIENDTDGLTGKIIGLVKDWNVVFNNSYLEATTPDIPDAPSVPMIQIQKIIAGDEEKIPLSGAEFVLYKTVDGTNYYATIADSKLTGWTTTRSEATTLISGSSEGINIADLNADTYYLEEAKAPAGYNLLTAPVTVVLSYDEDTLSWSCTKDGEVVALSSDGVFVLYIENYSGSELPSTGNLNLALLYCVGGFIAVCACAGIILIIKRYHHLSRGRYEK